MPSSEVAKLAGVSQKTVSRVFNDEPYVSDEIRQRVISAARELGYRRNNAARQLTSGRSHRLGVVSLGTALYGPASLLVGIERAARALGYALSVVNTAEGDADGIVGAVETLLNQGVDGIVLSEPIDLGPIRLVSDVPVLSLGQLPGVTAPLVITAGSTADVPARMATEYLLGLGHRTVHHVAGPQRWYSARERAAGWRTTLLNAGITPPEMVEGDWTAASGHAAGQRLAADPSVTAVFAGNDDMAIGVIRAMARAGRTVPADISVIGFDDIPVAAYVNPPLTTISQSFDSLAATALAALVRGIERPGETPLMNDVQFGGIVVRESTAPPRS
ncbi:LacI family DNA-binding transcriptional regulator [Actinoplanes sp. NPDC026670]|uniref:LacI family DNA-binding transcriptional regulator n=1 Tax=Actinoplanes sp. NPDC026670 TaxID=3154700 RepID=UPI0033D15874